MRSLIDHAAHRVGETGVACAVEDHLHHRALVRIAVARLCHCCQGEAVARPRPVCAVARKAEGRRGAGAFLHYRDRGVERLRIAGLQLGLDRVRILPAGGQRLDGERGGGKRFHLRDGGMRPGLQGACDGQPGEGQQQDCSHAHQRGVLAQPCRLQEVHRAYVACGVRIAIGDGSACVADRRIGRRMRGLKRLPHGGASEAEAGQLVRWTGQPRGSLEIGARPAHRNMDLRPRPSSP